MGLSLAQLAEQLQLELRGDGNVIIKGVATLQDAGPGELSFLANRKYRKFLTATGASVVILCEEDAPHAPGPVLVSANPYVSYARAARLLCATASPRAGIHPSAVVDPSATVDATAWVDAHAVIEKQAEIGPGVEVGPGCLIGAGVRIGVRGRLVARVTVLAAAELGERVILHPGVVIGSDGFGMAWTGTEWEKVPQLGSVCIGNDVEVGANTTIDRGSLGDTVIEEGVKIDNQVQVAHNVHIGAHTAIAGCVGISGSARIGKYCTLAGGVGIVGHLELADHVHITGMSMVTRSILEAGTYSAGTPLMSNVEWRRNAVRMKQLNTLSRRVSCLEKDRKHK